MGKTSIEWTDASWNPIVGCTEVSPGCANCYAARLAATRLKNVPSYSGLTKRTEFCDEHRRPLQDGRCPQCKDADGNTFILDMQSKVLSHDSHWTGDVRFLPERLEEPLHWRKPRRIFVCDMGDLFHGVPFFFKQWGVFVPLTEGVSDPDAVVINGTKMLRATKRAAGRLLDGREWNEFPFQPKIGGKNGDAP